MTRVLFFLSVIVLVLVLVYYLLFGIPLTGNLKGLFVSIIAGVITALITVVAVNWVLEKHREREQLPLKRIAGKKLVELLNEIINAIAKMEKSASDGWVPQTIDEILSKKGADLITQLDWDKPSGYSGLAWKQRLNQLHDKTYHAVERIIDLYAQVIPADLLEQLENWLNRSPLMTIIQADEAVTKSYEATDYTDVASIASILSNVWRNHYQTIGLPDPIDTTLTILRKLWNQIDRLAKELGIPRPDLPTSYLHSTNGEIPTLGSARLSDAALRQMDIGHKKNPGDRNDH